MTTTTRPPLTYTLKLCSDGWIELSWRADPDLFRVILAGVKAIPAQRRDYDPSRRVWRIASVGLLLGLGVYLPNLRERVEELLGAESEPRPAVSALPDTVARAYTTLYLLPSAPRALVEAARRVLARQHHPDMGGDSAAMVAINNAVDAVLAWLDRKATHPQPDPSPRRRRASTGRQAAA